MEPANSTPDGRSLSEATSATSGRLSDEEDDIYRQISTTLSPRPHHLPSHATPIPHKIIGNAIDTTDDPSGKEKIQLEDHKLDARDGKAIARDDSISALVHGTGNMEEGSPGSVDESLPKYSNSISISAVFQKKHELESTTKRAANRRWRPAFLTLTGTALQIHTVKRDWGLSLAREAPFCCPDHPSWLIQGKLLKTYSLQHADAGIAADYKKRRYVIRIRAEEDQFLISCIELPTFIKWLECLFAAIDVAAPIDDREFPRDMSIPRIQRNQWLRTQARAAAMSAALQDLPPPFEDSVSPPADRPSSSNETSFVPPPTFNLMPARSLPDESTLLPFGQHSDTSRMPPYRRELMATISSLPNPAVDSRTGKWLPEHRWTTAHDLLYAKLCYNVLLFSSPRKSNYIISKGKQWFVDWATGKMMRVLPPAYRETENPCTVVNCREDGHPDEE